MKIKQIEYSELKSIEGTFNNVRLGMIAELQKGENPDAVLINLKNKVREEIAKVVFDGNWKIHEYNQQYEKLKSDVKSLQEIKETLEKEVSELKVVKKYFKGKEKGKNEYH